MAKYRKRSDVIEAITFDEFVEYGRNNGGNIVNGMPWHFKYKGHPVTHENDYCYLIPSSKGFMPFTPADVLIELNDSIYSCNREFFENQYELAKDAT